MGIDAWITLGVIVVAFAAFATERVQTSLAMGGAVVALLLTGVIDQDQALAGLASSAPVTVAALYVLAGAATVTGALSPIIDRVLGNGGGPGGREGRRRERARLARVVGSAAAMSAVLPNTPLVALVAPRIVTWARRTGERASVYLMPLSFAAILGGVVTVIGTSTNLVISDLLRASGDEPLGVFEITWVGLPVALVGSLVLVVVAPRLLRDRTADPARESPADGAPHRGLDPGLATGETARRYTIAMTVSEGGPVAGNTVQSAGLRHLNGVFLAGVERGGSVIPARPQTVLSAGDICYFAGDVTDIVDLTDLPGLDVAERPHLEGAADRLDARLYEVVISERSTLAGATLADVGFRGRFGAAVLAVRRHDDELPGKLGTLVLRAGDVLLVLGAPDFGQVWGGHSDFSVVAPLNESPPTRPRHGWVVLVAIVAMIALAVTGALTLMEAAIVSAVSLLLTRVISPTEARRAVNLNVVLTMAASISVGVAVASSGLADQLASLLVTLGRPLGEVGTVAALLAATMMLTELLSNNASAALMFPVAFATGLEIGLDPRTAAIVVLIGASNSFLSPLGYQTNLMVHSLGGYRITDFVRLGLPLTISTLIVTPLVVSVL